MPSPPKSYDKWEALIYNFAKHLLDRYGADEVAQWYFEVWNEPNIDFWTGEPKQATYFELYDHAARAIKRANPRLRVGGPATAQAAWVSAMIAHSVEANVPLDFVSTHVYANDRSEDVFGTDEKIPRSDMVARAVRKVYKEVKESKRPALPIHWSEYNASYKNEVEITDSTFMGPWLANNIRLCDGFTTSMSYWTFSDVFEEQGVVKTPFYGGYGLIAEGGVPKAAFNAFAMLHRLGDRRMSPEFTNALVTERADGTFAVAVWNYAATGEHGTPQHVRYRGRWMEAGCAFPCRNFGPRSRFGINRLESHGRSRFSHTPAIRFAAARCGRNGETDHFNVYAPAPESGPGGGPARMRGIRRHRIHNRARLRIGERADYLGCPQLSVTIVSPPDRAFLEDLEHRAFLYFWEQADHGTGLVLDRASTDGGRAKGPSRDIASIAATGFGLTAICIGAERGWITREQAADRVRSTLQFFANRANEEHGWFYHWMDVSNGDRKWDSETSSVDTAFLLGGILTAAQYFSKDPEIPKLARQIYERVDFQWMLNDDPMLLSHGWQRGKGFLKSKWDTYSEIDSFVSACDWLAHSCHIARVLVCVATSAVQLRAV